MSDTPARPTARVFVQWKGTEVCLDFNCPCGYGAHFDGDFAYNLRCVRCGTVYEMPYNFRLEAVEDGGGVTQEPEGESHAPAEGPDVVDMAEDDESDELSPT